MLTRSLAIILCVTLALPACASSGAPRPQSSPSFGPEAQQLLADYVQKLPLGSKVRVEPAAGHAFKGTLMRASRTSIVVQKNTRLPEPPVEMPLQQVARVTIDTGGNGTGKAVAIGAAVGAAATFGVLLILAAFLND